MNQPHPGPSLTVAMQDVGQGMAQQCTWDRMAGSSCPHSQVTVDTSLRLSAFVKASS